MKNYLTLQAPTPQNGQTHSNNSSATADELFLSVLNHFMGLALKGLKGVKAKTNSKNDVLNSF